MKMLSDLGAVIVAVSDVSGACFNEKGLDADKIYKLSCARKFLKEYKQAGSTFVEGAKGNEDLLFTNAEILIPAALEGQITGANASKVKAKYIIEGANGPTTPAADEILAKKGVVLVPDILANCGGVVVSYFEWVQNLANYYWTLDKVNSSLEEQITVAFNEIVAISKKHNCTLRVAAYMCAIQRIVTARKLRGYFL